MPEDSQLARAQGIVTEIPQRRFSGARNWRGKPDPLFFKGGCAQKERTKIQIPRSKFQDYPFELRMGSSKCFSMYSVSPW